MEEEFENNDSLINNFQEELKNSKDDFKQEETILDEEIFQYTPNLKEIAKKDFSRYINKQLTPNKNKNDLVNNLNFKYTNDYNMNLDISVISLLKELEEQWNNIEKQKNISINNKNNKNDESTYSNSKSNTIFDKFKYITEMVEIKKNKFISSREKAKKERNDDKEIENYFLNKLKEMDKYKIIDEELKKNIEIRQEQKNNEDNYYNQQENENNINNNINDNENIEIRTPALEDLVYETPARVNNYINEYDNDNEDNVNIDNMNTRKEKNMMSGKLFNKMKNLYKEINGENNEENMEQNNSNESGVFGINNFNLKTDKNEENIILKNIRNNNNNIIINENNGNINDANKSISLNFNFINKNKNFVQKYEQNKFIKYNDIIRYTNDKNNINLIAPKENLNIFKDKNRMTLPGLQENFDEILKNVKSNHNTNNISLFNNNQINDEDYEDKEEFDKYFQDLSNEAKSNIRKNKNISEPYSKNKILKKIEENSFILNEYISGNSQNKNIFKQRMKDLNNNFKNIRDNDINNKSFQTKQFSRYNLFPNNII